MRGKRQFEIPEVDGGVGGAGLDVPRRIMGHLSGLQDGSSRQFSESKHTIFHC